MIEGDSIHLQMMEAQVGLGGSAGSASETMRVRKRLKRRMESINRLTCRLELITLTRTADGVIPLDLSCLSSREAALGPVGPAYSISDLVVATDGSLRKNGAMGAA